MNTRPKKTVITSGPDLGERKHAKGCKSGRTRGGALASQPESRSNWRPQMAFWKKPVELSQAFYRAAGECLLYNMESSVMAQNLEASSMTLNQACELLDLVREGLVRLRALIAQYPLNSDLGMRDRICESSILSCEENKKGISTVPEPYRSCSICHYSGDIDGSDGVHFARGVLNMATILGVQQPMVMKQMAKVANMRFDDFLRLAAQTVKDTPRGRRAVDSVRRLPTYGPSLA